MMLTSGGRPDDAERCREVGIHSYLTKPVKQADLFDAMCRALEGTGEVTERRAAPLASAEPVRRRNVLLAEDNVVNQRVAVGLLRDGDIT